MLYEFCTNLDKTVYDLESYENKFEMDGRYD